MSTQPTQLIPYSEIAQMGTAIAKSGLFGMKTPEQAIALMLIAHAEGMHPALAARDYHVIQGRPALKADAMLARFHAAGGKVTWGDYTDARVSATFYHPQGGTVEIDWTMERAKAAGLTGKENWRHYPRQMLRARVISEGVRTVSPGVAVGIYTPEEVQDFEVAPARPPRRERAKQSEVIEGEVAGSPDFDGDEKIPYEVTDAPAPTNLPEGAVLDHLSAIDAAADLDSLKSAFGAAWTAAKKAADDESKGKFQQAYDAKKAALKGAKAAA
jgi:hypothetical protein